MTTRQPFWFAGDNIFSLKKRRFWFEHVFAKLCFSECWRISAAAGKVVQFATILQNLATHHRCNICCRCRRRRHRNCCCCCCCCRRHNTLLGNARADKYLTFWSFQSNHEISNSVELLAIQRASKINSKAAASKICFPDSLLAQFLQLLMLLLWAICRSLSIWLM